MSVYSLTKSYFEAVDSMKVARVADFFAEDGSFRFGNAPAALGKTAIEQANIDFFDMISGLSHEIIGISTGKWESGIMISVELEVHYTRKNGTVVAPIPCVNIIRMKHDKMQDFRIFGDMSPLFAE